MIEHHETPPPPLYRWSIPAVVAWRREHPHLWRSCPAPWRRLRPRVYEPHDMLRAMMYVVGGAGSIAGFVALLLDMTR